MRRRGQGVVEVIAIAPLVVCAVAAFAVASARLAAMARAESALAAALAADAADQPVRGALRGRARIVRLDDRVIAIAVPAPLGPIVREAPRIRA